MSFASYSSEGEYYATQQPYQLDRAYQNEVDNYSRSHLPHAPVEYGNNWPFPQQYVYSFGTPNGYPLYAQPTTLRNRQEFSYSGVPQLREALETIPIAMPYTPQTNAALRHMKEANEATILNDWYSEWEIAEQSEQPWVKQPCQNGGRLPSLLTAPARINMHLHERRAKGVVLNYWGGYEDAPEGAVNQHWRWFKQTQEAMRREKASLRRAAAARRFYERPLRRHCSTAAGWQQGQPTTRGVYYQQRV